MGECTVAQSVEAAIQAISRGEPVLLVHSEGCCSLALAAELATPERVAFLIRHSLGSIRACLDQERLEVFGFKPTVSASLPACPYPPVDFLGLGATAKDRAATLQALCDLSSRSMSFSPGHIFPCRVSNGGLLDIERCMEAAYDLCRQAKLAPVAALADPMHEDGRPFTAADAGEFSRREGVPLLLTQQLLLHRRSQVGYAPPSSADPRLETESRMWMEEVNDECKICIYSTSKPQVEIVAITKGDLRGAEDVPVRIHSECFTGDILASKRCDCGQQLHKFLSIMDAEPVACMLYIRGHEGRGIGLPNKIRAYHLQDQGVDTVDANVQLGLPIDSRTYEDSLAVLQHLGIQSIKLFTNNPMKMTALKAITKQVLPLSSVPCEQNIKYLNTKRERMNHKTVLETFKLPAPKVDVSTTRIGLVYTKWNQYYVDELVRVAQDRLKEEGVRHVSLAVPGACELTSGARVLLKEAKPDAIIVIGVLIRGSSDIYDATCSAVMTGLTELNSSQDIPIVLGVSMCHNEDQAFERSHGSGNPAKALVETALHMASLSKQIVTDYS